MISCIGGVKLEDKKRVSIYTFDASPYYNTSEMAIPFWELLSETEKRKALRFVHQEDRVRSAVSSLLKKYMAQIHTKIPTPRFLEDANKKPYLPADTDFSFNISHSGKYVVGACTRDGAIGIDVEQVRNICISDYIQILPKALQKQILGNADPTGEFYRIWTLIEAYGKQQGVGVVLLDQNFSFSEINREEIEAGGRLYSIYSTAFDGHRLCVCYEKSHAEVSIHRVNVRDMAGNIRLQTVPMRFCP